MTTLPEIVTYEPRNAETPQRALRTPLTAADEFYVRYFAHRDEMHRDGAGWRPR